MSRTNIGSIYLTTLIIIYTLTTVHPYDDNNNNSSKVVAAVRSRRTYHPDPNIYGVNPFFPDDFYSRVVHDDYIFVDKTELIRTYLRHNSSSVILIRRPSGWGKTVNLDMIRRFLEIELDPITGEPLPDDKRTNKKLFTGGRIRLEETNKTVYVKSSYIAKFPDTIASQGTYPVIYLDFDRISGFMEVYSEIKYHLRNKIEDLYMDHHYLKRYLNDNHNNNNNNNHDNILNESDRKRLNVYINKDYGLLELKESLRFLSKMLFLHYRRKVHVLIDNYDAPICRLFFKMVEEYRKYQVDNKLSESAIFRKVFKSYYFQRTVGLLREILENCLQRNEAVGKALITGVLRFADKADPFANYTDLKDYTIFDKEFSEFYGLSPDETNKLLRQKSDGKEVTSEEACNFEQSYGGYRYGNSSLYNPRLSIGRLEDEDNFSDNPTVGRNHLAAVEFVAAKNETKKQLRTLIEGEQIRATVRKYLTLNDSLSSDDVFGTLLFAGYLTPDNVATGLEDGKYACRLSVPNREILNELKNICDNTFSS